MEPALRWLADHYEKQPSLQVIAQSCGLGECQFQRLFDRWMGLRTKHQAQFLSLDQAKQCLIEQRGWLDATYEAHRTSASRLDDCSVSMTCLSTEDYKTRGEGLRIYYGFHETPFSECGLASAHGRVCSLEFNLAGNRDATLVRMKQGYEKAQWVSNPTLTGHLAECVFGPCTAPLTILLRGTTFEVKVWDALLSIPAGAISDYADLAHRIGHTSSHRAVGRAVAKNVIAYLVPCHRVIRKSGQLGGYRWGLGRKLAMLTREQRSALC